MTDLRVGLLGCSLREPLPPGTKQAAVQSLSSSGRLLDVTLALRGSEGVWHLVAAYGPTMQCGDREKLTFWQDFQTLCAAIPSREISFFVGDFNCRVGSRHLGSYPD